MELQTPVQWTLEVMLRRWCFKALRFGVRVILFDDTVTRTVKEGRAVQEYATVVRGFCASCGREIGGVFKPKAWQCPICKRLYCASCCEKVGLLFKKPACPRCGIELEK